MKKLTYLLCTVMTVMLLGGCGDTSEPDLQNDSFEKTTAMDDGTEDMDDTEGDSWAVYWYLCGSDLESQYGAATTDLNELTNVELPENVTFVIQTGGASEWQNDLIDASELGRYVYNSEGFEQVESLELASMGEAETLSSFLSFCEENYPADHAMVLFWNHGGGSEGGVEFDEIYGSDSLTLPELDEALAASYSIRGRAYDIIGFDTCLMGTLENAAIMSLYADYMIASEETEPGNGWNYEGIAQTFADTPSIGARDLGIAICDTYMTGCEAAGTEDETTLSVIDLSKVDHLVQCVNLASLELVSSSVEKPATACRFIRSGYKSENYGGNNDEEGYYNQVDLGDLVSNSEKLLPVSAQEIYSAIDEAVVYKVNGRYRANSTGLSIYFPYGITEESLLNYEANLSANPLYSCFLRYIMEGSYPEETYDCIDQLVIPDSEIETESAAEVESVQSVSVFSGDMQFYQTEDGYMALQLDADEMDTVASVQFHLYILDEEDELMILLGSDNNINADWENGYFEDNFNGYWGCIGGEPCYMELVYEGEDYNLYSIPVKLNGEDCVLRVAYNFSEEAYEILGAIPTDEEESVGGAAQKNLIMLSEGDTIEPKLYAMEYSENSDDELIPFYMDEVIVTEDISFTDEDLGDSVFMYLFEVEDLAGNSYSSDIARMETIGGEIITELME